MPHNVPQIVPGYKINVQSADYENVPKTLPENVQKGGGRETGVILLILKQRYHNSQLTLFNTRPKLTKDLKCTLLSADTLLTLC